MSRNRTAQRALAVVVLTGLAALTACSSDDDVAAPTTTAPGAATGAAGDPGRGPTEAELVSILPGAAELGEGWVQQPARADNTQPDPTPIDPVVGEQCPALVTLLDPAPAPGGEAETRPAVKRAFVDGDGRLLAFKLDPDAPARSDGELQEAVDATNRCGVIVVDDVEVGDTDRATTTFRFTAAVDPDHGEQAVKLQAEVGVLTDAADEPVVTMLYLLVFRTGPVSAQISASDGVDLESFEVSGTDMDLLTGLSARLESAVDDLVG